jgi:uncharacterized protein (DUF169 family)
MYSKVSEKLRFSFEPVAVSFTDNKPDGALQFKEGKWGCVAAMLLASAKKGSVSVFDRKTYGCTGGGVGICFGDTFTKDGSLIECLLSTGDEALRETGKTSARSFGRGERFYATPELAAKWRSSFPYAETLKEYVVFRPLSMTSETDSPDIVFMLVDPDQLSALIIMSGFYRGDAVNAIAPHCAACQSIAYAYNEIGKEKPNGVIGFFDISQRHAVPKEMLSYTVPYGMYMEIERGVDEGCLTTEAWEKVARRP